MTIGAIVAVCFMLLCIGIVGCLKLGVELSNPSKVRPY
tara:strand:- start:24045 stop:24158 length:114 start_codon:yes stop_codon:yes gene_type:complete